ncbi:type I secretion system permease/ATPase [Ideonella sp. A 288]|uniref:type I secretion system permease/ATPase n=1 Tax=Ideonella sp. A 288 TaxID=1962181 RepID=UPI000B4B1731|nr:type I secretion system permease/ATPase [Ideonella sp. A 288]
MSATPAHTPSTTVARPTGSPAAASTPGPRRSLFERSELGRVLWTFRREFAWVCVFSMFVNLLQLTPTLYMLQVFDRVMLSGNTLTLLALTGLMVFFYLVQGFAEWVRSRLLVRSGGRFDEALNRPVFSATYLAQLSATRRNSQQPLTDLNFLRTFLTGNGVFAVVDTPWTVVYIAALFLMHPWLGWASIVFSVVQGAMALGAHRYTSRRLKATQELALESGQYLQAKLRNAETVEAMGMQGNLRYQWLALHDKQMASHAQAQEATRRIQALAKWVQYTQQGMMLALGALLAIDGKISAGAMVASNALMGNALRPIGIIVQIWSQFVEARQAFGRLDTLLQSQPAPDAALRSGTVHGQVSLRGLVATAPGRASPILQGLDADFKAGEVVAIMGPSGAGKSTLARCLLGIWPDTEGQVLIDGHPVQSWSREALGPYLGYLPQDIELFDGTIAENIARFSAADPEQIIEAATRTGIHDMILRLPKGYDTPIGEAGSLLSGGQRQRIGLARAIVGAPTIVVLDEPNANLDDAGEAALARTVRELKTRGATVFMIVHQQHLIAVADRLLVLDAGRIDKLLPVVVRPAPTAQPGTPNT